uniref:CCHC-type domain-containing protein n=1 Tax=Aegilops tauschii subsp. strangulata TaxID=200361 RepID=A0A453BID1_AEGTS
VPHGRPVVSGLGLSGSPGSARSSSVEAAPAVQGPEWRRPGPSRKAMWRRRRALRRQQAAGAMDGRASPSSSERRLIPPDLYGLCFRCFQDGHRRQDCSNDPLCIRCGEAGHVSAQCTQPRSPIWES